MEWQPIETAPKDGSPLILYSSKNNQRYIGRYSVYHQFWRHEDGTFEIPFVSHWIQLPPPPSK